MPFPTERADQQRLLRSIANDTGILNGILLELLTVISWYRNVGVAVAAVLQSNTASTMLVITLANASAFSLDSALMLIYGTNLGAIALRLILAAELRGTSLQLVRFEDLFCLVSGALMVILYYAESWLGVPLIRAAITRLSSDLKTQLALAFLLSNVLPAIVIFALQGKCQFLLARLWPATVEDDEAKPKFINPNA